MSPLSEEQLKALVTLEVVHELTGWPYDTIMRLLLLEKRKEQWRNESSSLQ